MINKKFEHSMLMSGGALRFGYYLGIYSAAVELNQKPDAIFATCGGSISAGIISAFDSIKEQKEALLSREIYTMLRRCKTHQQHSFARVCLDLCSRYVSRRATTIFPDLNRHAIFEIENESQPYFPFTPQYTSDSLNIAVIGSKLCFNTDQIGTKRKSDPLFEEVIFGDKSLLNKISDVPFSPHSTLIKETLKKEDSISFQHAIRISISDIYCLPPYLIAGEHYMGGMLDLVPFNLAQHCSNRLSLELKQPFSNFSDVPAFLHLLGYDPNEVLQAIPRRENDIWIDTSDSPEQLKGNQINHKIRWLSNQIAFDRPTYDQYRVMMQAQWDYGYHKGLEAFNKHK